MHNPYPNDRHAIAPHVRSCSGSEYGLARTHVTFNSQVPIWPAFALIPAAAQPNITQSAAKASTTSPQASLLPFSMFVGKLLTSENLWESCTAESPWLPSSAGPAPAAEPAQGSSAGRSAQPCRALVSPCAGVDIIGETLALIKHHIVVYQALKQTPNAGAWLEQNSYWLKVDL